MAQWLVHHNYKGGGPARGLGPQGAHAPSSCPSDRHNDNKNGKRAALISKQNQQSRNTNTNTNPNQNNHQPEPNKQQQTQTTKQGAFMLLYW